MRSHCRLASIVFVALVASVGGVLLPTGATETQAATTKLTLVSDARYDVQPARHRVHVTVDISAANHTSETVIRRYFFDHANLAVLPGTSGFAIKASGAHPTVRVASRPNGYTLLAIGFGRKLYSGKSMALRLTFDLNDSGGGATRAVRITNSLATFPVWAYASDGTSGSSVSVAFPAGYSIQEANGTMGRPAAGPGGTQLYSSGRLATPLRFSAYFIADRPGAFAETPLTLTVAGAPLQVVVRPWADDPAWGKRTVALLRSGLPALGDAIGLPYRGASPLTVEEAIGRTRGGSIGEFDPSAGRVRIAYYADTFTTLRELALAWFNGGLLADRWADEAFASYYAQATAKTIGLKVAPPSLTPALQKARLPLNAWQPSARADDRASAFVQAAGLSLARGIASRAGPAGLQVVWRATAAREAAYRPSGGADPPDTGGTEPPITEAPDWRGLLDLLETRTGKTYDDLWRTWVVTLEQTPLVDSRRAAGELYRKTIDTAGDWQLPASVRLAMDAWRFDQATEILVKAGDVLQLREPLRLSASQAGLTLPTTVRTLFEQTASPRMASDEADAEGQVIAELKAAQAAAPVSTDVSTWLGLFGTSPEAMLAQATVAFGRGDLPAAVQSAQDARAIWQAAPETGRRRFVALILSALIVLVILLLVTRGRAAERRRRRFASRRSS